MRSAAHRVPRSTARRGSRASRLNWRSAGIRRTARKQSWTASYTPNSGESQKDLLARAVAGTAAQVNDAWKQANMLDYSQTATLTVTVPADDLRAQTAVFHQQSEQHLEKQRTVKKNILIMFIAMAGLLLLSLFGLFHILVNRRIRHLRRYRAPIIQLRAMLHPLPDLRAANLRGRGIFH